MKNRIFAAAGVTALAGLLAFPLTAMATPAPDAPATTTPGTTTPGPDAEVPGPAAAGPADESSAPGETAPAEPHRTINDTPGALTAPLRLAEEVLSDDGFDITAEWGEFWLDMEAEYERAELNRDGLTVSFRDADDDAVVPDAEPEFSFVEYTEADDFDYQETPTDRFVPAGGTGDSWTFTPAEEFPAGYEGFFGLSAVVVLDGEEWEFWSDFYVFDAETVFWVEVDPELLSPGRLAQEGVSLALRDYWDEPVDAAADYSFFGFDDETEEIVELDETFVQDGGTFTAELPSDYQAPVFVIAQFSQSEEPRSALGVFDVASYLMTIDPYEFTVPELAETGVTVQIDPVDAAVAPAGSAVDFVFEADVYDETSDEYEWRDVTGLFSHVPGTTWTYTAELDEDFEGFIDVTAVLDAEAGQFTLWDWFYAEPGEASASPSPAPPSAAPEDDASQAPSAAPETESPAAPGGQAQQSLPRTGTGLGPLTAGLVLLVLGLGALLLTLRRRA
ncbi:hypothetical protein [Sediminivirga luteola]|uniref:Gram-positive cocci surface proteins LPxTG domain-containing protein n=1 Tax=Sediminivirga luteola TaxID=1774748 RepID=A0A8J2U0R4_9MICO|nr:hypothetical protein [Sediminivirga luteola]GGA25193.1 hypothetical protein GCM10011333_30240 [Sediminivirga luteola]